VPEPDELLARPSAARIYDAALGGKQNLDADREVLAISSELSATTAQALAAHHRQVHRVARHLTLAGMDQFLLIGSGLPSALPPHATILALNPMARVVYAERDPLALGHARALFTHDRVRVAECDISRPEQALGHPFLDWDRPIAAAVLCMLEVAHSPVEAFRAALAPGSFLWLTLCSMDGFPREVHEAVAQMGLVGLTFRTVAQCQDMLDGLDLVEPGLAWVSQWRPDGTEPPIVPEHCGWLTAVARL
jgi:hypothetical protein